MRGGDSIPELITAVYDAALDPDLWPVVLTQFAQAFGSTAAHLAEDHVEANSGKLLSYGVNSTYAGQYGAYYASRNLLWRRVVQRSLYGVQTDRIVMPRTEFAHSEFYNDFLRLHGGEELLFFSSTPQNSVSTTLVLWREEHHGVWDAADIKALAAIAPHLDRSLGINRQVGDLRLVNELAAEALYQINCGVVLVDNGARVLFVNRAAERFFEGGDMRLQRKRLMLERPGDTSALHRLIAETAQSGAGNLLVVQRPGRAPVLLMAVPMKARAIVPGRHDGAVILFIRDIDRRRNPELASFTRYFGLTAAEAATAAELLNADGVTAAAGRLGLSRSTVRTHLVHIFQKTGTRRQAELVRLILTWSEPLLHTNDH